MIKSKADNMLRIEFMKNSSKIAKEESLSPHQTKQQKKIS